MLLTTINFYFNKYQLYLIQFQINLQDQEQLKDFKLVQLIELSRHGARAPYYDLWDFRSNWKLPLKTLTNIGMRQHYLIGKELYHRYSDSIFNNGNIEMGSINILSTSTERAQQSALCQLQGILDNSKGQKMHSGWVYNQQTDLPPFSIHQGQQILQGMDGINLPNGYLPINVKVHSDPKVLEPSESIKGYSIMKQQNFLTDIYKKFEEQLTEFKKEFIEKFELDLKISDITVKVIADYWDSVICDIYEQIPLPKTFTKEFIQKLNFVYDFQQLYINFNGNNGNLLKVQTTAFFHEIINLIRNNSQNKFQFYSASDGNLNAVLISLGYSTYTTDFNEWLNPTTNPSHSNPSFASIILFEVYEHIENQKKYVRVIYNDKPVQVQGCSSHLCNFEEEFVPSLHKYGILPEKEYQNICQL